MKSRAPFRAFAPSVQATELSTPRDGAYKRRKGHVMLIEVFDDKRVVTAVIALWTALSVVVFLCIMLEDNSPFLSFGPNSRTQLMGVTLDTWGKWCCVAVYTFVSTCIAAFASDAVVPWIMNTIQDHKTHYIPYSKTTCLLIIQTFTVYAVIMSTIGMFVALTQVDFMLIRVTADLLVNWYTTYAFLRNKQTNPEQYRRWLQKTASEPPAEAAPEAAPEPGGHVECLKLLVSAPPSDDFGQK